METLTGLYSKIRKGNKASFEQLFRLLYKPLSIYANGFIGNHEDAEEMVQDVFFRFWINRKRIKVKSNVKAYLYTCVKNKCLVYIQHRKVRQNYAKILAEEFKNDQLDMGEYIDAFEMESVIGETLNSFTDRMKDIFVLSRFEGMKYQEIADRLSVSVKTVESNISAALKIFRKTLGNYMNVPS